MKRILKISSIILLFTYSGLCNRQLHLLNNGENSWVNIGDMDIAGNQITLEALIYIENFSSVNIVSKHMGFEDVNYLFRFKTFELTTYKNGNRGETQFFKLEVPFNFNLNQWYHVAATYNGALMKYYVNGCKVAEMEANGNLVQNNFDTAIGNRSERTNEQFFGWMDEVRIWNIERSEQEIQANMMEVELENGLIGYYKFDESLDNEIGNRFHDGSRGRPGEPLAVDFNPVDLFEEVEFEIIEPFCFGGNDGGILVISNFDYQYALDGMDFSEVQEFMNLPAGNYALHVRGHNLCFISHDSIQITEPEIIESIVVEEICMGDSTLFNGIYYKDAGTYSDTLSSINGCDSFSRFQIRFIIQEFLGQDTTLCSAQPFTIKSNKPNTQWIGHPSGQNLIVNESGLFIATYIDENGCTLGDSIRVEYIDTIAVFLPSAFSPNDDGINDIFEPYFNQQTNYEIQIFDRWGNQLYRKDEGWDGRFMGKRLNAGIYLWILEIEREACGIPEIIKKAGDVSIFVGNN